MSFLYWPKVAVLALLPAAAIAHQVQQFGPTDVNAPVPASGYVSVFENYRPAAEDQGSPVEVWRAANEEVARNDPHAGHTSMPGMKAQPAAQQTGSAQPDPHAGHGGHMAAPGMSVPPAAQNSSSAQPEPHAGHGTPMASPRANTDTATPKAATSKSDPHAGHGGQHNMQGK